MVGGAIAGLSPVGCLLMFGTRLPLMSNFCAVSRSHRLLCSSLIQRSADKPTLVVCVTQQPAEVALAILVSVLTLVRLVVADDTPSCSTRGAVTGHVTSNATDYRTFNASLSICRADSTDSDSQNQQCNEHFHCKPPMSQPIHKKGRRHLVPSNRRGNTENGTN
jgi:hypothetical protein